MTNNDRPAFASIKDFCKLSGLSQFCIRQRIKAGTLPFIRSGNTYFVNVTAALEVLDKESKEANRCELSMRKTGFDNSAS